MRNQRRSGDHGAGREHDHHDGGARSPAHRHHVTLARSSWRRATLTGVEPQSITVFRSRLRDDVPGRRYGTLADELEAKARAMPGFVEFKEFVAADGERLALVTFD